MSIRAIGLVCPLAILPMRMTLFPSGMLCATNIPLINSNNTLFRSEMKGYTLVHAGWVLTIGSAFFDPMSIIDPVMRGQRSNFRNINNISTLHAYISDTMKCSDLQLSPACFSFNSEQIRVLGCCYSLLRGYFWRIVSRKGTASHSSPNSPDSKLGQWRWLTWDSVKEYYKHLYVKNYPRIWSQDLRKPQQTTKLGTKGRHGVSQSQWPRMTFARSRCNVKSQM